MIDRARVLDELKGERDRIDHVLAILKPLAQPITLTPLEQKYERLAVHADQLLARAAGKRYVSPEARRRMSVAAKRRWQRYI